MQALFVMVDQLQRSAHPVAQVQFANIANMDFGRVGGEPAGGSIGGAHAKRYGNLVARPVEQHIVIGHVEVAIIVDPVLF